MAKRATKKATTRKRRTTTEVADWGGVDEQLLAEIIRTITRSGGAVRFGYSRDGGAYSLGVYGDGDPFTEFCPPTANVEHWLYGFVEDYKT